MGKFEREGLGAAQPGIQVADSLDCHSVGQALKYSSPLPWILALTIGTTMWGGLAWLILRSMG